MLLFGVWLLGCNHQGDKRALDEQKQAWQKYQQLVKRETVSGAVRDAALRSRIALLKKWRDAHIKHGALLSVIQKKMNSPTADPASRLATPSTLTLKEITTIEDDQRMKIKAIDRTLLNLEALLKERHKAHLAHSEHVARVAGRVKKL
ncbi:hypothetical protein KKF84_11185 [Myxococcota bacterium]|nr:hypothetical protein [Myxococcota bacterium]